MQQVDYSKVAERYDNNVIRHEIPRDHMLAELDADGAKVLDLGCGTGNYLAAQDRYFPDAKIAWHGVDPSESMLAVARTKVDRCALVHGRAEMLPFDASSFDYVVSRFAFHHFSDKHKALEEIWRVLRPGGVLRIENFAPELSPDWWLYRYFPEGIDIDRRRFWSVREIEERMRGLGFAVKSTQRAYGPMPVAKILAEARNRDTSQLILLCDELYAAGLNALERDLADVETSNIDSGLTLVSVIGRKE